MNSELEPFVDTKNFLSAFPLKHIQPCGLYMYIFSVKAILSRVLLYVTENLNEWHS